MIRRSADRIMGRYLRASIGLVALAFAGCMSMDLVPVEEAADTVVPPEVRSTVIQAPDSIAIGFGWSYGMCDGYCRSEFMLHSWGLVCERVGWDTAAFPMQRQVVPISVEKYRAIVHAVDTTSLWSEFSIRHIGCPDCADGGRCWVEVRQGSVLKRVVYDCVGGQGPHYALLGLVTSVAKGVRWWEHGGSYVPFDSKHKNSLQ